VGRLARRTTTPATLLVLLLASFAVLLGCAVGCGELLRLAERADGSTPFDRSITTWVVAHRASGLTTAGHVLSTLGSQFVLAPLAVLIAAALVARRRNLLAASLVAAWGGAILLYNLTKLFVGRPRPPMYIWLTNVGKTKSFPSGHATQSMATFSALALVGATWLAASRWPGAVAAVMLAGAIGWSRVYLGVHWTTDVIAGWLIGAAWVALVWRLATHADLQDGPTDVSATSSRPES
jgi:membrane-associated phospholipid phosphatase